MAKISKNMADKIAETFYIYNEAISDGAFMECPDLKINLSATDWIFIETNEISIMVSFKIDNISGHISNAQYNINKNNLYILNDDSYIIIPIE